MKKILAAPVTPISRKVFVESFNASGRRHVRDNYAWDACVQTMISVYEDTIRKFQERV